MFVNRRATADVADEAALIVTELVTNAVAAGTSTNQVELTVHRTHLELTVGDDAPGRPQLTPFSSLDQSHRGLHLVNALASTWTVQNRAASRGKDIIAELTLLPDAVERLHCTSLR